jgi:hypothetical protein
VWPENWPAFRLFADLETQWDYAGMGQRANLKYLVLFAKMDRMRLTPEAYDEMEGDIRVLEHAALAVMNAKEA